MKMNFRYFRKLISTFFIKIYRDKKLILIFVFFLSISASLFFLSFLKNIGPEEHKIPGSDYLSFYEPVADNIFKGQGILIKEDADAKYPIGYPLILSALFSISDLLNVERIMIIIAFNVLVAALTVCFLFLFVKSFLNKKIALISAVLWATYPLNLWFIKNPNTEVPFILILYASLWLYILAIKKGSLKLFFSSGFLIGLISLIRPIAAFLIIPLVGLIFLLVQKKSVKEKVLFSIILTVAYIIVISPWIIYVFLNTGKIIPLSTNGPSSIASGLTMMFDNVREDTVIILPNDVVALINESRVVKMDSFISISTFFFKKLVSQPITSLKLIIIKIIRSWYATSEMWWEKEILMVQLLYLIPGIAGIGIWLKKIKEKFPYLLFLSVIIFYFWLATVVAFSILRYMIPVMGIFMIFSAITFSYLIDRLILKQKGENRL